MYQNPPNSIPVTGPNAVTIQIFNPTATTAGGVPCVNQGQICNMPSMPPQQYPVAPVSNPIQLQQNVSRDTFNTTNQVAAPASAPTQAPAYGMPANSYYSYPQVQAVPQYSQALVQSPMPAPQPQQIQVPVQTPASAPAKEDKKPHHKKEIVQITDDYIKTLEGCLRDKNAETRLMGAKELLKRFKEDQSRKHDTALSSLLNLTLQDPSQSVRFIGLTILNCDYAQGDSTTVDLLKQLEKTNTSYNQDANEAKEILLKMAGKKINVTTNEIEEKPEKKSQGNKLNVMST